MSKKVLFLVPYPLHEAPSQRFRFEQYFQFLDQQGIQFAVQSFLNSHNWQLFFRSGNLHLKVWALAAGVFKRLISLGMAMKYDFIFVHREITPFGPPVFEWALAKILRKKIIYDFDDAIWLTDRDKESRAMKFLKRRSKVESICRWSFKVSCGNEYLCAFAETFANRVILNPTTIDTRHRHNPALFSQRVNSNEVVVGWTGSHSTLKYLKDVESVLQKIETEFPFVRFVVIANQEPSLTLRSLVYIPWVEKTEIEDLLKFDIGIMPLPNQEWAKGKCGFKALQYLALGIPAVVSPVGVNKKIIDHSVNGFLCNSHEEWEQALRTLINDSRLRKQMGDQGRKKVEDHYSVASNSSNFLSLFE